MTNISSLPLSDSPLNLMFLRQYVSKLMQETIANLKLPYDKLAHEMSIATPGRIIGHPALR